MKKKVVFVALCVALLLFFTSSSYGWRLSLKPQPVDPPRKQLPSRLEHSPCCSGHGWEEIPDIPSGSGTPGANVGGVNIARDITTVVPIRFGNIDLFFIGIKGKQPSGKKTTTF